MNRKRKLNLRVAVESLEIVGIKNGSSLNNARDECPRY